MAGRPSLLAIASGDALGGLVVPPAPRARLVGCRPWATAQAAGPVVSCTRPLHQAGQARGRWATGCFSYFLLL